MSLDITEAKRRLPLPDLMQRLGYEKHAAKNAFCPFHDNHKSEAFSVWQKERLWFWKCFTGCGSGDEITFIEKAKGLSNGDAIRLFLGMAGVERNGASTAQTTPTKDDPSRQKQDMETVWRRCVEAFMDEHVEKLAKWRGYSVGLVSWLKAQGLIGLYKGHIAFPVHEGGATVGIHYRLKTDGSWRFYPTGGTTRLLVIGDPKQTPLVVMFESQWDGLAIMDTLSWHTKETPLFAVIVTRGASNGRLIQGLIEPDSTVLAFMQNDPSAEKWLQDVCAHVGNSIVKRVATPTPHNDWNDWTRAGATEKDIQKAIKEAVLVQQELKVNEPNLETSVVSWPKPPDVAAFHGVVGKMVQLIEPHTESDPVALLVQMLTAFGNMIGRTAYFTAEADKHYSNLSIVLAGLTSKGRKGSSLGQILVPIQSLDEKWVQRRQSGLSSGEGLIWAVRDPIEKQEAIKESGRIVGHQTVIVDEGVFDKRLLVVEPEFAQVLKVSSRENNTLSATIRMAWDSGDLRTLTKNSPACATGAHISIIGHITKAELLRHLSSTECANGFANRFLWVCVRRSKVLPEGGALHTVNFADIIRRLQDAVTFSRRVGELRRDQNARALWHEVYEGLSAGKPGLLGAITSRAEAQVMRLAVIYAVLDSSSEIKLPHLQAALAVWRYCEASARFIFGNSLGDPMADTILQALRDAGKKGVTRTEIANLFKRHTTSEETNRALAALTEASLAVNKLEPTEGRHAERWFYT